MINFTVGPVQSDPEVLAIGSEHVPYFRTPEFSAVMLENERLMCKFADAPESSRAVFLTASGTGAMEASVMHMLTPGDKAIVINGGTFGQRFAQLLAFHNIPHTEIRLDAGEALTQEMLDGFKGKGYTAFLVNIHETSTGVHYDPDMIGSFCRENGLFLIVDAISSFLADEFSMRDCGADVMITSSQKALACPPGISVLVLDPKALDRVEKCETKCMYLDLKDALKNQERGQTPFTPAVGTLLQINTRLKKIDENGGVKGEIARIAALAEYFRGGISGLPFEMLSKAPSNAVTALRTKTASANDIFTILKDEYSIWVCPNGGALRETVFRVGHIGYLKKEDYDTLLNAFRDLKKRGII